MEAATLARLKRRNRDARAACTLANSCRQVLAQHAALQEKSARQQQRLDHLPAHRAHRHRRCARARTVCASGGCWLFTTSTCTCALSGS